MISKSRIIRFLTRYKCVFGSHVYHVPQVSTYGVACRWIYGGYECVYCKKFEISRKDLKYLIDNAYEYGVREENKRMIAYGRGLEEIYNVYPEKRPAKCLSDGDFAREMA